jgi:hypothetical protein
MTDSHHITIGKTDDGKALKLDVRGCWSRGC